MAHQTRQVRSRIAALRTVRAGLIRMAERAHGHKTSPDALFAARQGLAWVALQDLTLRAQQLPHLISYARPRPLVTLALAYRLYRDATRASELVALNDAPHPLFMPLTGRALAA